MAQGKVRTANEEAKKKWHEARGESRETRWKATESITEREGGRALTKTQAWTVLAERGWGRESWWLSSASSVFRSQSNNRNVKRSKARVRDEDERELDNTGPFHMLSISVDRRELPWSCRGGCPSEEDEAIPRETVKRMSYGTTMTSSARFISALPLTLRPALNRVWYCNISLRAEYQNTTSYTQHARYLFYEGTLLWID